MEIHVNGFILSDDKEKLQIDEVCRLLHLTLWAKNRPKEVVVKSIEHSLCFGVYDQEKQIGFSRCITDYSTFFWIADVIIDPEYRGLGLGKALTDAMTSQPEFAGILGGLITKDAHELYAQYGFVRGTQQDEQQFMYRPRT